MNSKLLVPLVLALSLGTASVNAAEVKTHKHVTATFKTHDGKEIRCLVPHEDEKVLKKLRKGESVKLIFTQGTSLPTAQSAYVRR